MQKIYITKIIISLIFVIGFFGFFFDAHASDDLTKLYNELKAIESRLNDVKTKKKTIDGQIKTETNQQTTLTRQISYLEGVIDGLENNIEERNLEIEKKQKEVEILEQEIEEKNFTIAKYQSEIEGLNNSVKLRLNSTYKEESSSTVLDTLISNPNNISLFEVIKYYETLRLKDREKIEELRNQKKVINDDLKLQEEKRIEIQKIKFAIEEEKNSLVGEKEALGAQTAWKAKLIETSKQNQKNLENSKVVLSEEEVELSRKFSETQNAIFAAKKKVDIKVARPVKTGDIIGREGCTGLCTGDHLHFSVDANGDGSNDNPCNYLPSGVLSGCGTANPSISWPMKGTFYLTSSYGYRSYPYKSFHSAIDIAYPWGTSSDYIYAAHDGYLSYGKQSCSGSLCKGGYANYAIICSDANCSLKTGYWHLE